MTTKSTDVADGCHRAMTTTRVHRVVLELEFPAGLAPGAGKSSGNALMLARDGRGRPVLRGTALAGALRHAWQARPDTGPSERWFGRAAQGDTGIDQPSPLRVADAVLHLGDAPSTWRQHNAIDRHTGAARPQGLFALEALPPGTRAQVWLYLHLQDPADEPQALVFLEQLVGLFEHGLVLGGQGARGLGRVRLHAPARARVFDLTQLDGLAAWLDESWRARGDIPPTAHADDATLDGRAPEALLRVRFGLAVPRGQDVCLGDGQALDHDIEPQQVTCADGQSRWHLPGSALRGVMRAWVARLAAREGRAVADSVRRFQAQGQPATGNDIGWGGDEAETRKAKQDKLAHDPAQLEHVVTCPVLRLFGSLYAAGRIHVSDALSEEPVGDAARQTRRHVAVDRITGGASEGFLFDHLALTQARFQVDLSVRAPDADEARWLASALRAIDFGLIRLGSSKSAGRLALSGPVVAEGPESAAFASLTRGEVRS